MLKDKMKTLIVEDDIQLNTLITSYFEEYSNNEVVSVEDGDEAVDFIDNQQFDLYVIDINIPNINGLDLVKYIRSKDIDTPIVMITASLELDNLKTAYSNGCNEYIKKPFHLDELDIRINKLINSSKISSMIKFTDDFYYDTESQNLYHKDTEIIFRNKEKQLLTLLMKNINTIVQNETIYSYVWADKDRDTYPLRQLVNDVRKKLPYDIIRTKVKEGYIIEIKK